MITLFTTPKPFEGHIAIIQQNAIISWTLLKPKPEIIVFGNEKGVADICRELGLIHIGDLTCNEYGTPLLNDLFGKAQKLASNKLLCYVNADIILMSDFTRMVEQVKKWEIPSVVMSRRWDVDINKLIKFDDYNWEVNLREYVHKNGRLQEGGMDYFIFPKGLYKNILPFVLGRGYWDDWLSLKARQLGARSINATNVAMAIHQIHNYSIQESRGDWSINPEVQHNWKLNGGWRYFFHRSLPTHILTKTGLKQTPFIDYFIHVFYRVQAYLVQSTYKIRRNLGLYSWWRK